MAELKTKENDASVEDFLDGVDDEQKRADCKKIAEWMRKATGDDPKMWGDSIIGFGSRVMKYSTGRELDWLKIGFAPRKANISLYGLIGKRAEDLLSKLGKHKTGKGCLLIKKLSDVDEDVLSAMIKQSADYLNKNPDKLM